MDTDFDALLAPKRITAVLVVIAFCISAGLVLSVAAHATGAAALDVTTAQTEIAKI